MDGVENREGLGWYGLIVFIYFKILSFILICLIKDLYFFKLFLSKLMIIFLFSKVVLSFIKKGLLLVIVGKLFKE